MTPQVDLFLFIFWRKLKDTKGHFKINLPLHIGSLSTAPPLLSSLAGICCMKIFLADRTLLSCKCCFLYSDITNIRFCSTHVHVCTIDMNILNSFQLTLFGSILLQSLTDQQDMRFFDRDARRSGPTNYFVGFQRFIYLRIY